MDPEGIIRDPRNATHLEQRQAALDILAELDAARARVAELGHLCSVMREQIGDMTEAYEEVSAENERLRDTIDAADGIICNAHSKVVDDVTTEDGASPGWAEAARRWIDAYPPAGR